MWFHFPYGRSSCLAEPQFFNNCSHSPRNGGGNFRLFFWRKVVLSKKLKSQDFCQQEIHTPARACTRHPARHRDTTVSPTCATVVFHEMLSTTVPIKHYCLPTIYLTLSELQVTYRPTLPPSCLIVWIVSLLLVCGTAAQHQHISTGAAMQFFKIIPYSK